MVASSNRRWWALALLSVVQFMLVLDIAIVNVALPSIQEDLGFSQENLQWVNTARPAMNRRLRPTMSAARPPSSRKPPKTSAYALITHWRFSCENPRSSWIEGRATFTIAMSRMSMN